MLDIRSRASAAVGRADGACVTVCTVHEARHALSTGRTTTEIAVGSAGSSTRRLTTDAVTCVLGGRADPLDQIRHRCRPPGVGNRDRTEEHHADHAGLDLHDLVARVVIDAMFGIPAEKATRCSM